MRLKILVLFLVITNNITAQSPGYMNKYMSVGIAPKFSYFKIGYTAEFNLFNSENNILCFQLGYSRDKKQFPQITDNVANINLPAEQLHSSEIIVNAGLKKFRYGLAPVGSYFSGRVGLAFVSTPYRWQNIVNNSDGTNSLTVSTKNSRKIIPQLIVGFGKQRVFFKKVIFDGSLNSNFGYFFMSKNNSWRTKYVISNILYYQMGITVLI